MKKVNIRSVYLTILIHLLCPLTSHASSPPADSVVFCGVGHEQWRRDHIRPASKRPANLNRGEPRTVRVVLFSPSDRPFRISLADSIKSAIKQSQIFFGEQMQAHGYGYKTFQYETDAMGEPVVHRVEGQHPESHYFEKTPGVLHALWAREIEQVFDIEENIYVFYRDISKFTGPATGYRWSKKRGYASLPAWGARWGVLSHELAHAFGRLEHDFRDGAYILSYGGPTQIPGASRWDRISACTAEFLSVHPYFDSTIPIDEYSPPAIRLISPARYPGGSESISVRLEVSDAEGIHQVLLSSHPAWVGYGGLRECRTYEGQRDVVVQFEYDGSSMAADPQRAITSLSDSLHPVRVTAVDTDGNMTVLKFDLVPDQAADVLKGHTDSVNAVAFFPDGKTLATGSSDGTVKLWDASRRELLATLKGHAYPVTGVAISVDGTLASGLLRDGVKLWDVKTRNEIASLEGMAPVALSPNGSVLASGAVNHTITLWDVRAHKVIAILEGHTAQINSVAFSPDGMLLASGSGRFDSDDKTVRLWDVARREEVASFERGGPIRSVGFSPAGDILAAAVGSPNDSVHLWDVRTHREVARLWPGGPFLSVAFSPDGSILAAGSSDGKVMLWDALTQDHFGTFLPTQPLQPSASGVRSLAFSTDGTTLAAGLRNHTVKLRDVSEWSGPRPAVLEMTSGDGQQGAPGETLTRSLVVEVRDQYGNPLSGAAVTFTVNSSDGTSSVENAATDANGRANITLTLGSQSGTNTVVATVADLEPVTFTAVGYDRADFDGDGTVGFSDFVQFAGKFGLSQGDKGFDARFDLDGNGAVGFSDFLIFAGAFGKA